jgi:transcriptional regulator with XRE-family HTH domain
MARTPEKLAFAERLRLALGRSTQRISTATELALQFNLRFPGKPVTNQAVQKWLSDDNSPTPDKIEMLATMLSVSPIWLRHGIEQGPTGKPRIVQQTPVTDPSEDELHLLGRYRQLSPYQRDLVSGIIEQLALNAAANTEG